jgi:hypothetical protein
MWSGAFGATLVAIAVAQGQVHDGGRHDSHHRDGHRPTYQRRAFDWARDHDRRRDGFDRFRPRIAPQVSGGWFQRPYPYHLDYYKMRWGGSYAPYFGNLYGTPFGTPQVIYGGGQRAGNWGPEVGYLPQGSYPPAGYEWMEHGEYLNAFPPEAVIEQPAHPVDSNNHGEAQQQKNGDLPEAGK